MSGLDTARVSSVVTAASRRPGGISLLLNVFRYVPGVVHAPAKRSVFRSEPERVLIGDWRYEVARDGRLRADHVVNGIVIAHDELDAHAVGEHVARALEQLVVRYGPDALVAVEAAVEALDASS